MRVSRGESPGNGDERRGGILGGAKERSIEAIQENRRRKRGRLDARKRAEETFGVKRGRLHVKK